MEILFTLLYTALVLNTVTNIVYLRSRRRRVSEPATYPSVSVLVPARNEEQNLRRLIPSLLEQDYDHFEIIVYDDASEDRTAAVVEEFGDERIKLLEGTEPPPGWVGKVYGLYQATRVASGDLFLFLDADARLNGPGALRSLVRQHDALPKPAVLSGMMRLSGGGALLVSMIPFSLYTFFPMPLAVRMRQAWTGVLAGGCWMIARADYRKHEPHQRHAAEVLEDLMIARYLKGRGMRSFLSDLQPDVDVRMYEGLADAWLGLRKSAGLLGGTPAGSVAMALIHTLVFIVFPLIWWPGAVAVYLAKFASDRFSGFSLVTTLLAPVSLALAILVTLDSARGYAAGKVVWKGREVAGRP